MPPALPLDASIVLVRFSAFVSSSRYSSEQHSIVLKYRSVMISWMVQRLSGSGWSILMINARIAGLGMPLLDRKSPRLVVGRGNGSSG